jgi:hypothetical protein
MSKVEIPQEIREQLIKYGCVEQDGVWTVDNIKIEFENLLHITFYVNGKRVQGYTGVENILSALKDQMEE